MPGGSQTEKHTSSACLPVRDRRLGSRLSYKSISLSDYEFLEAQSSQAVPASPEERRAQALASRLAEEMAAAWRRGARPSAETFLARHSELAGNSDAALRLIYEEICLRQEAGEEVLSDEIAYRFPQWQSELRALLECHEVLQPPTAVPPLPPVGEMLGDFRLLKELGRGALGRVFLAAQTGLGDRQVVLKITPRSGQEHLSLARLQHTHIVPLYAVQDFPARNLRLLCMPFLGGTTLGRLLEEMRGVPQERRSGYRLLDLLDRTQAAAPADNPNRGPVRQMLGRASYVEAVCWIGACLAEALHYAHERALVHLDVKPSNVLLAADGQPMLLDFHLAREPLAKESPAPDWLGGTLAYMSPEQRAALESVRERRPVAEGVTGRSDVYALGLVLYEALSGGLPREGASPRLERLNPLVSTGLADVIHKCLAPAAVNRYADAATLAADLRRHLGHLPLRGVPNRSLHERWCKWRRRRPQALTALLMFLVVAGATATVAALGWRFVAQERTLIRRALEDGRHELLDGRPEDAVRTLARAMEREQSLPGGRGLEQELATELERAYRAVGVRDLHTIVERLRLLYDAPGMSLDDLRTLAAQCRDVWGKRETLLRAERAGLPPAVEEQMRLDLLDLALLLTDFQVRQAEDRAVGLAQAEALEMLREAESLFGPSPVLARREQSLAEALGLVLQAAEAAGRATLLPPRTAWEHLALGRSLLHRSEFVAAERELRKALDLEPQGFWPNFYAGVCAFRREKFTDAYAAFHACVALASETAECYYNRALARTALGNEMEALADYTRALQLDPSLAPAALNRGVLYCKHKNLPAAATDLKRALTLGADAAKVHYNLALVHLANNDHTAALASLRSALHHNPQHPEALELHNRLTEKER